MYQSQFIEMFGGHSNVVKLKDVVTIMDDKRKPINEGDRSSMKDGELYPYYGATGVVDYINEYLTDERLLCIAEDCGNYGPGEESSYIIEGKAWVNNHAHVVKPNDELCDITYLHNFFKVTDLLPFVSGTTRKKLTQKAMNDLDIILPPIDKQREYVAICDQADKSKFDGFKSQFIEMFGSMINPKYDVLPMASVCERSGQYGSNTSACDYISDTPRYIRITDINDDGSLNDDIKSAEAVDDKYLLKDGDLVFARTGATVGKTYLHHSEKAIYAGYLIKYHPVESRVNPEYLFAYTHSSSYYSWVELTKKVGAQPNISATQYDELPVIVPPIDKQKEFVIIAQQADKSKSVCRLSIKQLAS